MLFNSDPSEARAQRGPELRSVGHGIVAPDSGWSFGGSVWRSFDQHIRASVPGYDDLHETIAQLAEPFLRDGGSACDIGCSTGTLTFKLAERFPAATVLGIDIEPTMVAAAKRLSPSRPRYLCADLACLFPPRGNPCEHDSLSQTERAATPRPWTLGQQSFILACYTLMFIPIDQRLSTLRAIRRSLKPGSVFVLAEKVRRRDPAHERRCQAELFEFKRAQGLTDAEIRAKSQSIRHSLLPLCDDENVTLLYAAGFRTVQRIFSRACFDAWVASA